MKKAIYPGSFDPLTLGHLDIIERSARIVDELVVGVLNNSAKNSLFSLDERVSMIKELSLIHILCFRRKKSGSYRLVLFYRFESFKYTADICSIILSDTELAYDKSGGNLTLPCAYDRILCMACIQFGSVLFSCAGSFVSVLSLIHI